jgi:hypothetical protein
MIVVDALTRGLLGEHVMLVRAITIKHSPNLVLHEERTVVRVGADDVLDLTTTNIARKIAS